MSPLLFHHMMRVHCTRRVELHACVICIITVAAIPRLSHFFCHGPNTCGGPCDKGLLKKNAWCRSAFRYTFLQISYWSTQRRSNALSGYCHRKLKMEHRSLGIQRGNPVRWSGEKQMTANTH